MQNITNLNQILIKSKVLGDHVFYTLKHCCQTKEYDEIGLLLLTALEEVRGEKRVSSGLLFSVQVVHKLPENFYDFL